jgi:predicted dehydrogenase
MFEPLRGVVVGGGMGGRLSLNALQSSPLFSLIGVADLREDVRAALATDFGGLATFASHTEMFAALQPAVVCVSTYAPTHEEVAIAALTLPSLKGILVEKPLGIDTAAGKRILEAIATRGVPVVVPHGMLAKATPLEIIRRVQADEIGRLVLVEIQCKGWDILNAGIHWLHFCRMLAPSDAPVSVHCAMDTSTKTYRDGLQVETAATTSIVHTSGLRVILHTGDETPINVAGKAFVFRLVGEKGTIEFWGWENGYLFNGELVTPTEYPTTGHRRHLENLAQQCRQGAPHDNTIPQASLEALELCEAAYLSGNYGVQVALPLTNAVLPDTKLNWVAGQPYSGVGGGRDGRQFG